MTHLSYMCQSITLCQMFFFENWWGFIMSYSSSAHFFLHHWCCNSWWTLRRPWPAWRPVVFGASCGKTRSGLKTRSLQRWNGAVIFGRGMFSRWWFQRFFISTPTLGKWSHLPSIFFRWVGYGEIGCWVSGVMKRPVGCWLNQQLLQL